MVDRFSTSPPRPFRADYILAYSRSSLLIKDIIIYYYWFISAWPDPARLWNVCERKEEGQCVVLLFQATCLTLSYSFPLTSLSRVHLIQVNCLSSHMRSLISDICNTRPKRLNVLYCLWWRIFSLMPQRPCKEKSKRCFPHYKVGLNGPTEEPNEGSGRLHRLARIFWMFFPLGNLQF